MTALGKIESAASWTDLRDVFEKALAAETAFDDGIYAEAIRRKREDGTAVDDRLADLSALLGARVLQGLMSASTPKKRWRSRPHPTSPPLCSKSSTRGRAGGIAMTGPTSGGPLSCPICGVSQAPRR